MDPIALDFANVSDELVPEGEYECRVKEAEVADNKKKDGQNLNLRLVIMDGPHENRLLFVTHALKASALWALKRTLVALGYDKDSVSGQFQLDPEALIGANCIAVVEHQEWEGEPRARVSSCKRSVHTKVMVASSGAAPARRVVTEE